ncbi:hypothetical protein TNCV_3221151 [Trichonephila clavipes]|nr:hypothetical protein TNCV_3221151 [Trichonephila clavipes]
MIEELHRPLKSAVKCHATERWTEVLPIILLGLRASLKEDILCTPAELVLGPLFDCQGRYRCKPAFFLNTEDLQLPQTKNETPATVEPNATASTPATVEPNATASTPATVESDPTASTPTRPSTRSGRKVHLPTSQLASLDKNNALREIKLRLSYLQGKSTTMSVIAHQTEKEWISANEKSRQRMSQTQAEGAAKQHAARLEEAHLQAHHSCFTTSERC